MILGLDISTKTGYAVMDLDGKLLDRGTFYLKKEEPRPNEPHEYEYIRMAENLAYFISSMILEQGITLIAVEQTNQGRNRDTQKLLEFLHCMFLKTVDGVIPRQAVRYVNSSEWRSGLAIRMNKDQRLHNKLVKAKAKRGKIKAKHLAVKWVNETYGLELKLKDNDQADAVCLCAYVFNNPRKPAPTVDLDAALAGL